MRPTQDEKGRRFVALHARPGAFLIPNPWDAGTARILEHAGFEAARVDTALAELTAIDPATLGDFRGVGRAKLPSTVIGCLVHGAEHAMRHVGQLSVTARVSRDLFRA